MTDFIPTRAAALERLSAFVPHAGRDYAKRRNHDLGPGRHAPGRGEDSPTGGVSTLSPYIRHRTLTEPEVLEAVLGRHSRSAAEKFIQEVYWRTYWKGWLEMRPTVWDDYQATLSVALDDLATQGGLRRDWETACRGETGIDCFDAWAQELVETGYLHNHARMWFASIWIFTLRLPWALGADFFLRHLNDGDPASNTLGWRWVAGLQTPGKTYLARASNIAKFTDGRFQPDPGELAPDAPPVDGAENPPRMAAPQGDRFDPDTPSVLILHEDDLSPGWLFDRGLVPKATALLNASGGLTPLEMAPSVLRFREALVDDAATRWAARLGPVTRDADTPQALADWARDMGAAQIVTPYAPVGAVKTVLDGLERIDGIALRRPLRGYDAQAWPYATAGFFKFKDKIPTLLGDLRGLRAA